MAVASNTVRKYGLITAVSTIVIFRAVNMVVTVDLTAIMTMREPNWDFTLRNQSH